MLWWWTKYVDIKMLPSVKLKTAKLLWLLGMFFLEKVHSLKDLLDNNVDDFIRFVCSLNGLANKVRGFYFIAKEAIFNYKEN